jgi:hypothetical protein
MAQLYRHYDRDGVLLYIGITNKIAWRLLAHERNAGWWRQVRTVTISDPYPTREAALAAEPAGIALVSTTAVSDGKIRKCSCFLCQEN